ncbi:DEAD/DEAH box helicase [Mollicutes bacterium LVI A0078]|nr:DEAD/DEAH box helicase [Mollicutes bacterium LVI A0075]WOO91261.1 DEAD/DEAH box helicase [Mollicutes bacterium LVI A0078]
MNIQLEKIDQYEAGSKIMRNKAEEIVKSGSVGLITEVAENTYKTVVVESGKDYLLQVNTFDIEGTRCSCSTNQNYGRCQHVLAFLIDLQKYLNSDKRSSLSPSEVIASNFTNHFNYEEKSVKTVNLRPKFLISEESNVSKMSLVIKFEGEREYKVANIATVVDSLANNKSVEIVKKMELISGEYKINRQTKKIIDILKLNKDYRNAIANSLLITEVELSSLDIISILEILKGQLVDINFSEGLVCNPPINQVLTIKKKDDNIVIGSKFNHKMQEIISGRLVKSFDNFYLLDESQSALFDILKPLGSKNIDSIDLPLRYYEKFMMKSKTVVEDLFKIESDDEFNAPLLEKELTTNIYISKITNAKVAIKVEFAYEDIIFGFDGYTTNDELVLVKRDQEHEAEILSSLNISKYDYQSTGEQLGFLVTKSHKQTYELLTEILPSLKEIANIYVDEAVENKMLALNSNAFSVSLTQSESLDFFEFNYELDEFSIDEINQMITSYRNGDSFYVLNDDKYIPFNDDKIMSQLTFIDQMQTEFTSLDDKIPFYRFITLKHMSNDLFSNVQIDEMLEDKLEQLENISVDTSLLNDVTVRDYQQAGMNWLNQLHNFKLGGILADEMGLGKTLQVIGYLNQNKGLKSLIVVPKALMYNWAQEFSKFAPDMAYTVVNGTKSERTKLINEHEGDVIITSYNMLRLDIDNYEDTFDVCIIDEAQTIKNPSVQVTKAVKKIKADLKFALTGTPLENNLVDLWSIVDFVNPHYLKSQADFKKKFVGEDSNIELLKFHLSPILLRRQKKDVLKELPDKIETPVFCELSSKQKVVYASYVRDYHDRLTDLIETDSMATSQIEVLSLLTRLRQIACHPGLFLDDYDGDSGKLELLMELMEENIENGNKMLVFSQFTSFLKIVQKELEAAGISFYYLDGSTNAEDRIKLVEEFNNDQTSVFLISLKAGGVGLNLTSASTVIHLDPWWNPQVESQATDRAHRIGQKQVVQVNKLITKGTIEEKIYMLQQEKKQLTDDILSLDSKMLTSLSTSEIIDLFTIE